MLKATYWFVAVVCLFVLPGVSIIMAVLYGCYAFIATFFERPQGRMASHGSGSENPYGGPENAEVSSEIDPEVAKRQAAAYAAEAEALELERENLLEEHEQSEQNALNHRAALEQSMVDEAEQLSWQDRLEAEARG